MKYTELKKDELKALNEKLQKEYEDLRAQNLSLDLSRGKPGKPQLDMMTGLLSCVNTPEDVISPSGVDYRNYGILDGIPEAKKLMSDLYGIPEKMLFVGGNASLNLMYDTMARCMLYGTVATDGTCTPWVKQGQIKFLCPAPGYDRHFAICQSLGIEMITVKLNSDGPDMAEVKRLAESDPQIKGIWCCPKYSNPDGVTYSDDVVRALASLKPAAKDFRIFWDNAYAIHFLYENEDTPLLDIFKACKEAGNEDMPFYFSSTSKISFPGSGISIFAASERNMAQIKPIISVQTIGYDKINMMRHVKYFKTAEGILNHMKELADVLRPKFEIALNALDRDLSDTGIARWTKPKGGYFISLYLLPGTAKRTYDLCNAIGVKLTTAGATYPYGKDPDDSNIRLAPSYPSNDQLSKAMDVLTLCARLAAAEALLNK